jgi:hypothetical protein
MENNDYSSLDFLFPNYPKRVLNEDASEAAAPAGAAPAPGMISNPPAETTVAKVTDAVPAWITDGIKYWEAELAKNPGSKEIEAELKRMKDMAEKGGTVKEATERKAHKIIIELETGNAEFDENESGSVDRIIKGAVQSRGSSEGVGELVAGERALKDVNGNTVGSVKITEL